MQMQITNAGHGKGEFPECECCGLSKLRTRETSESLNV